MKAFNSIYKATCCTSLLELTQEISLRWHLTPHRLSKFIHNSTSACWRGCGFTGTIFHILWACPHLIVYWDKSFQILSAITISPITPLAQLSAIKREILFLTSYAGLSHIFQEVRLKKTHHWSSSQTKKWLLGTNSLHIWTTNGIWEGQLYKCVPSMARLGKLVQILYPKLIWLHIRFQMVIKKCFLNKECYSIYQSIFFFSTI